MQEIEQARKYLQKFIKSHPELKEDAMGLYDLLVSNIEDGESPTHELGLFINDIDQLVEDGNND
jgi:hypothetical protein